MDIAVFGAGCFWCVEAIFQQLHGVTGVVSGYTGGNIKNPTYKEICSGNTNHVEVCKIIYDSNMITYKTLLKIFFEAHNPTTLNKQGNDFGMQYRSAIFYIDNNQKQSSINYINKLNNNKRYENLIVTDVTKLEDFYDAEDYHQNYFKNNTEQPYCQLVIKPKLDKLLNENKLLLNK